MMGAYHIVGAMLILVVVISEGWALQCYECNSETREVCETGSQLAADKKNTYKVTCGKNATSCRKMEQEIYYDGDYHTRTIRQCAYDSGPLKCVERTGTYRFKVYYCHCAGDFCNSANPLIFSMTFALVLAGISAAITSVLKL